MGLSVAVLTILNVAEAFVVRRSDIRAPVAVFRRRLTTMSETSSSFNNSNNKSPHLASYNLYSWMPDLTSRSLDENYMDVVMFITRSGYLRQGSMGCIIVKKPSDGANLLTSQADFYDAILAASTNEALFGGKNNSDIHAEITALGLCSQNSSGSSTTDAIVYITMPPCKNCFGALVAAGIRKIVSNKATYAETIADAAKERNIELVSMGSDFVDDQKQRINTLIHDWKQKQENLI